jgi:hypothetical protein
MFSYITGWQGSKMLSLVKVKVIGNLEKQTVTLRLAQTPKVILFLM